MRSRSSAPELPATSSQDSLLGSTPVKTPASGSSSKGRATTPRRRTRRSQTPEGKRKERDAKQAAAAAGKERNAEQLVKAGEESNIPLNPGAGARFWDFLGVCRRRRPALVVGAAAVVVPNQTKADSSRMVCCRRSSARGAKAASVAGPDQAQTSPSTTSAPSLDPAGQTKMDDTKNGSLRGTAVAKAEESQDFPALCQKLFSKEAAAARQRSSTPPTGPRYVPPLTRSVSPAIRVTYIPTNSSDGGFFGPLARDPAPLLDAFSREAERRTEGVNSLTGIKSASLPAFGASHDTNSRSPATPPASQRRAQLMADTDLCASPGPGREKICSAEVLSQTAKNIPCPSTPDSLVPSRPDTPPCMETPKMEFSDSPVLACSFETAPVAPRDVSHDISAVPLARQNFQTVKDSAANGGFTALVRSASATLLQNRDREAGSSTELPRFGACQPINDGYRLPEVAPQFGVSQDSCDSLRPDLASFGGQVSPMPRKQARPPSFGGHTVPSFGVQMPKLDMGSLPPSPDLQPCMKDEQAIGKVSDCQETASSDSDTEDKSQKQRSRKGQGSKPGLKNSKQLVGSLAKPDGGRPPGFGGARVRKPITASGMQRGSKADAKLPSDDEFDPYCDDDLLLAAEVTAPPTGPASQGSQRWVTDITVEALKKATSRDNSHESTPTPSPRIDAMPEMAKTSQAAKLSNQVSGAPRRAPRVQKPITSAAATRSHAPQHGRSRQGAHRGRRHASRDRSSSPSEDDLFIAAEETGKGEGSAAVHLRNGGASALRPSAGRSPERRSAENNKSFASVPGPRSADVHKPPPLPKAPAKPSGLPVPPKSQSPASSSGVAPTGSNRGISAPPAAAKGKAPPPPPPGARGKAPPLPPVSKSGPPIGSAKARAHSCVGAFWGRRLHVKELTRIERKNSIFEMLGEDCSEQTPARDSDGTAPVPPTAPAKPEDQHVTPGILGAGGVREPAVFDWSEWKRLFAPQDPNPQDGASGSNSRHKKRSSSVPALPEIQVLSRQKATLCGVVIAKIKDLASLGKDLRVLSDVSEEDLDRVQELFDHLDEEQIKKLREFAAGPEREWKRLRDVERRLLPLVGVDHAKGRLRLLRIQANLPYRQQHLMTPLCVVRDAASQALQSNALRDMIRAALKLGNYANHGPDALKEDQARALDIGTLLGSMRSFKALAPDARDVSLMHFFVKSMLKNNPKFDRLLMEELPALGDSVRVSWAAIQEDLGHLRRDAKFSREEAGERAAAYEITGHGAAAVVSTLADKAEGVLKEAEEVEKVAAKHLSEVARYFGASSSTTQNAKDPAGIVVLRQLWELHESFCGMCVQLRAK